MTKRRKLTLAMILAGALAGIAITEASAAPVNGRAITTATPNLTTEVQYWGYGGYRPYRTWYPTYGYYGW